MIPETQPTHLTLAHTSKKKTENVETYIGLRDS